MKNIFFVSNHQNIGCKLVPKGEKKLKFETRPFTNYQTRSGILNHCAKSSVTQACNIATRHCNFNLKGLSFICKCGVFEKSLKRKICRITDSGCKSGRQQQQFFRIYISGVSIWHEKKTGKSKTDQLQRLHKFVNSPSRPLMSRFSLVKSIHSVSYSFQPSQKITQSYAY